MSDDRAIEDKFPDEIKRLAVAYSESVGDGINHPYYAHHLQEALASAGFQITDLRPDREQPEGTYEDGYQDGHRAGRQAAFQVREQPAGLREAAGGLTRDQARLAQDFIDEQTHDRPLTIEEKELVWALARLASAPNQEGEQG